MDENQEIHGPEGRGNRRLASESTPVDQGQDFATSTGTLDRLEMSELSDISTEIVATRRSPTDNTMMAGVTEKQATSSLISEREKNTFGNIFAFTTGASTGDEGESQEEEEDVKSKMTLDLKSASIVRPRSMKHTPTEGLVPWPIWCSEDNKQNHKHIRPVKKLCEYDNIGNANWGE